jgi:hypothetical protein
LDLRFCVGLDVREEEGYVVALKERIGNKPNISLPQSFFIMNRDDLLKVTSEKK